MKIILLTSISLFYFVNVQAQSYDEYAMYIGDELTQKTNGYINLIDSDYNDGKVIRIVLPQDKNFDNVRSQVNSFINNYSDINVAVAWRETDDDYNLFITAGENEEFDLMISYFELQGEKYLLVMWGL